MWSDALAGTADRAGFNYDMMLEQGNAKGEALIMGGANGPMGKPWSWRTAGLRLIRK